MTIPLALTALIGLATAQGGAMSLCTTDDCGYCPNSITTDGTGYPACVIYDRDTVLGGFADSYEEVPNTQSNRNVYFDIAEQTNPECQTIIRSPAHATDPGCGVPIYAGPGGLCFNGHAGLATTFMTQFCCGTDNCADAGANKRSGGSVSSAVLRDQDGNVLVPHSVGHHIIGDMMPVFLEDHGLNASSRPELASRSPPIIKIGYEEDHHVDKRTHCKKYIAHGPPYTKLGLKTDTLSGRICGSQGTAHITVENSVASTTTFGSSVTDPFGIVSASVSYSIEKEASQSHEYEYTPLADECGHLTWTPYLKCTKGVITGCSEGDQHGETCTAIHDGAALAGAYSFVQTS